jgi:hypothetical protein
MLVFSSLSGWINNESGLAWLQQVFDCFTKQKTRSKYRLLTLDGHGFHVTMDFINYGYQNIRFYCLFSSLTLPTLSSCWM